MKLKKQLDFNPKNNLITGLEKTINWYIQNEEWLKNKSSV